MLHFKALYFIPFLFLLLYFRAGYANELELIQNKQEQLLKNEQLRQEREFNQFNQLTPPPGTHLSVETEKNRAADSDADAPCIIFESIELEGVTVLSKTQKANLLNAYIKQCLSAEKLTRLQADITSYYIGLGYITTRVYFPKQDFSDKKLRVWVLEGKYESFEIFEQGKKAIDSNPAPRSGLNTVFKYDDNQLLNLRDLEQAVDQINRLSSRRAQMVLEPGQKEGRTRVKLYTNTSKPWFLSTSLNNGGSDVLGEYQSVYSTRFEDILGLYELWAFSYTRELNANRWDRWMRSYTAFLSLPYQYWTLNLSTSLYEYQTPIRGQTVDYSTSGNSRSHSLAVKRIIHRDQKGKTQLTSKIGYSEIRSYVQNTFVEISSRKTANWSLEIDHSRRWNRGTLSGSLTYERGMPWWDATDRISYDESTPTNIYSLWKASTNFYKAFRLFDNTFSWESSLYAQWSPHTLYNTQRAQIGGQYSVRGFEREIISGDRGAYWRNDLRWIVPQLYAGVQQQIFIGLDVGGVLPDWREETEQGWIQGAAWGFKFHHKHLNSQLQWEHGLHGPSHTKPEPWLFRFNVSLNI